jgi:hypothetical protein
LQLASLGLKAELPRMNAGAPTGPATVLFGLLQELWNPPVLNSEGRGGDSVQVALLGPAVVFGLLQELWNPPVLNSEGRGGVSMQVALLGRQFSSAS